MEWPEALKLVSQLSTTGVLAFLSWNLWQKCQAQDAEIARLNEARTNDLKEIVKHGD